MTKSKSKAKIVNSRYLNAKIYPEFMIFERQNLELKILPFWYSENPKFKILERQDFGVAKS